MSFSQFFAIANTIRIEDSLGMASLTLLVYDHLITFADEVKYIWKKPKTPFSCLYLLNRYFASSGFFLLVLMNTPSWPINLCFKSAKIQGVCTALSVMLAELILVLRVYAVHHQSKLVFAMMMSIWSVQIGCMSYVLAHTIAAPLPRTPITFGCFLISDPAIGNLSILYVAPSMVFDTTVFIMLSTAIVKRARAHPLTNMFQIILRDGILYFTVVLLMNAAWLAAALNLPENSQNTLAFPCVALTVTLIGRLTLNLRKGNTSVIYDTSTNVNVWRFLHVSDASTDMCGEDIEFSTVWEGESEL